jgi:sorbitol-specific phosphotransferase system component IIC
MISVPMALPFVVLLIAALAATLGLRRSAVVVWIVAAAIMVYAFAGRVTDSLNIAL